MPTNEELRRQSGAAQEAARRAQGQANQNNRRAGGASMEASRRGATVVEEVNRLIAPPRTTRKLPTLQPVGASAAGRSRADYTPPRALPVSGGIAGPLVELDYSLREYWSTGLLSSDGMFTDYAIAKIVLTDAEERVVEITLAPPL